MPCKTGVDFKPWFFDEDVLSLPCSSMSHLERAWYFIGTILLAVKASIHVPNITPLKSCRSLVSYSKPSYDELRNISFTGIMKRKWNEAALDDRTTMNKTSLSDGSKIKFLKSLHLSNAKSAILSVIPFYSEYFRPEKLFSMPTPLCKLYDEHCRTRIFTDLASKAAVAFQSIKCTRQQAALVEESTREQGNSKLWWLQRAGRITSSMFYKVYHASRMELPLYVINSVCYGEASRLSKTEFQLDQQHAHKALEKFKQVTSYTYIFFEHFISKSILFCHVIYFNYNCALFTTILLSHQEEYIFVLFVYL